MQNVVVRQSTVLIGCISTRPVVVLQAGGLSARSVAAVRFPAASPPAHKLAAPQLSAVTGAVVAWLDVQVPAVVSTSAETNTWPKTSPTAHKPAEVQVPDSNWTPLPPLVSIWVTVQLPAVAGVPVVRTSPFRSVPTQTSAAVQFMELTGSTASTLSTFQDWSTGSIDTTTLPLSSPPTHNVVCGQDMEMTGRLSTCTPVHAEDPPVGFVDT